MPQTLCTSVFQPSDGIWYMNSLSAVKRVSQRETRCDTDEVSRFISMEKAKRFQFRPASVGCLPKAKVLAGNSTGCYLM